MPRGRKPKAVKAAEEKQKKQAKLTREENRKRLQAESNLVHFISLVHPQTVLGNVHVELCNWLQSPRTSSHKLVLLPRDHQKSRMAAYYVAWRITQNPAIRVLYISSTSNLATKQLKFIKDILTSDIYRKYWPEMVHEEEGKREKWTETEIAVDHPYRKKEYVRDPTVFTAGLTTSITGLHCDLAVLDDVVVQENAYDERAREKVRQQYSLLSSIEGADAEELVVGTRYHPEDLYYELMNMKVQEFDEDGNIIKEQPLFDTFIRQVESRGDGTGEFLWPRQQRSDGKWFGFNREILARKKAQYIDQRQFRSQYYNDPVDMSASLFSRDWFRYYDRTSIHWVGGVPHIGDRRLNVVCAADLANSTSKEADYTAIVVVGMDYDRNIYVLDIERFKTDRISDYYHKMFDLYQRWNYRKLVLEAYGFQKAIIQELISGYFAPNGLFIEVEQVFDNTRSKEERITAELKPRYEMGKVWHYSGGGNIQILEEELLNPNPSHDDVKDALAWAAAYCIPPSRLGNFTPSYQNDDEYMKRYFEMKGIKGHPRFGGV